MNRWKVSQVKGISQCHSVMPYNEILFFKPSSKGWMDTGNSAPGSPQVATVEDPPFVGDVPLLSCGF